MQLMSSLQLEAYNYIKNLILTHQLDVNTLYSETKLSKELGISRTPMREALQCLSQDGYITVIPSKGFRIRQLSQKDMRETIQIRCAIEGFMLGINGVVTFKKSTLPETLTTVPLERIVLETDSPYLAPVPNRGKRNESANVKDTLMKVAEIYQITPEHVAEVTSVNALKVFGIRK